MSTDPEKLNEADDALNPDPGAQTDAGGEETGTDTDSDGDADV